MYTLKKQQEFFIKHREELMKTLLTRAISNNLKVSIASYSGHPRVAGLYYNLSGINLRFDCSMSQYSCAREKLNEKIKIARVAELAEVIRKVRMTYHNGQDIIDAAIISSRRNY
jgi:hypothetical protein